MTETRTSLVAWLMKKVGSFGALPSDGDEERAMKASLFMTSAMMAIAAGIWSVVYIIFHRYLTAAIPGTYFIITAISIVLFALTKRHRWFRSSQLLLIMVLPFMVQWSLGGFAKGSAVMLWAFLPMMGALVFHPKYAVRWFVAYEALTVVSVLIDLRIDRNWPALPPALIESFWLGNVGGLCLVIFLVVRYFLGRNASILEEIRVQRKQAHDAWAKVAEQAEQLQELDRSKTLFFANVSHELRTPLTLLLGPLQSTLEESSGLNDDQRRRLTLASRNGRRLLRQINLLLDFTKAEAGKMTLDLSVEDPVALARAIVEESAPAARARNLTLTLDAPAAGVLPIEIDRDRIDQALLNLVSNAIKFTPEGGKITLALRRDDGALTLALTDTGIGIPKDEIPKLFQSFRQVQRSTDGGAGAMYRQEHQGTGLGLALSKQIVELHGGTIDIESELGVGTTFRVRLPIVKADRAAEPALPAPLPARERARGMRSDLSDFDTGSEGKAGQAAAGPAAAAGAGAALSLPGGDGQAAGAPAASAVMDGDDVRPRVLLVDDNPDVRSYLTDLLHARYQLLEAVDGQQGIDVAIKELPDLIISDVMMPKKSGFELVDALKTTGRTRGIPILLLTARSGVEGTIEGLRRGADDYLSKPFDPKELLARSAALLRLTKVERELAKVYARVNEDLEAAQTIQNSLMPTGSFSLGGLDLGGTMITASQLGGDFFDFLPFTNGSGHKVGIAIGDVTGHGAASALVTAVAKASLETHVNADVPPPLVLSTLSRVIFDSCKGKKLMTFFYGVMDSKTNVLTYANAGHTFPLIYNEKTKASRSLCHPGVPLGVDREAAYEARSAELSSGDVLVLFSDGIVEAETKTGKTYGSRRLQRQIVSLAQLSAQQVATGLVNDALTFAAQPRPEDDMTAVILKVS